MCASFTRVICFYPLLTPAGKESTERSAIGNWSSIGYLLCVVYGCFCRYCWAGTVFRHGPRYSYFICLRKTWNAMGHVSPVFLFTPLCIPVIDLQTLPSNFRYVVTSGAVLALCSTLMGSLLPQVYTAKSILWLTPDDTQWLKMQWNLCFSFYWQSLCNKLCEPCLVTCQNWFVPDPYCKICLFLT